MVNTLFTKSWSSPGPCTTRHFMNPAMTYQDILRMELAERISKNSSYSLRALAKQMGVSPSLVSDVLKGKKGLSSSRAMEVGQALNFDGSKLEYFVTLVQLQEAKSAKRRSEILQKLEGLTNARQRHDLSLDAFRMIYDWYHVAILELVQIADFKVTPKQVAKKLGITEIEAEAALQRLLRLELLVNNPNGTFQRADNHLVAVSKIPNSALRNFHTQMLKKATEALTSQTPDEKIIGSETLAFDQAHLKEANLIIEDCFAKLVKLASSKKPRKDVYHLGIQFFRLTTKGN